MGGMHRFSRLTLGALVLLLTTLVGSWMSTDTMTGQAAPPPYDADNNKLIDRQEALTFTGDPDYVKDGKFYDVGRNPDPKPGYAQTSNGDYRFRVTHIKFDISPDVGADDVPGEALEIWHTHTRRLAHVGEGRAKGEWIYQWMTTDQDRGRNEPALYVCREMAKIMVRIESASPVDFAQVGAKEVEVPGQRKQWIDVKPKRVDFQVLPGFQNHVWVSKGEPLDPNDPAAGFSEYVELDLATPIKDSINKSACTWQWYVDRIMPENGQPGDEWVADTVCNGNMQGWEINRSEGYKREVDDDGNVTVISIPHTFFTVLGKPTAPYYRPQAMGSGLLTSYPWVTALEFAIVDKVKLRGYTDADVTRERIATFVFADYRQTYDHTSGASIWVRGAGVMGESEYYFYQFSNFISGAAFGGSGGKTVNCVDQASSVATLIDLTCGSDADVQWLPQFGYVPKLNFVGAGPNDPASCNNPFYRNSLIQPNPVVGDDDTRWRYIEIDFITYIKRSLFDFHTWVEGGGKVYDATVGPTGSGKVPTIIGSRTDYRAAACDVSNTGVAGMEWRDDEAVPTKAPGYLPIIPNVPWLEADYTDTQYTIEVKNADFARVEARPINIE